MFSSTRESKHMPKVRALQVQIQTFTVFSLSNHNECYYSLTERVRREKIYSDFFIDASHELSLFAWNKGRGHKLTQAPYFCASQRPSSSSGHGCAIYFKENNNNNNNRNNIGQQYRTTGTLTVRPWQLFVVFNCARCQSRLFAGLKVYKY